MNFKSYLKKSRRFASAFYGAGCEYSHLAETRRGDIREFSHDSIIRLCFFVDGFTAFKPSALIVISFQKQEEYCMKIIKQKLRNFLKSLSNYDKEKEFPLFIWRLVFDSEKKLNIRIISDTTIPPLTLLELSKIIWKKSKYDFRAKTSVFRIASNMTDTCILDFCLQETGYLHKVGRWWGAINQSHYTRTVYKRKETKNKTIKKNLENMTEIQSSKIRRRFYTKMRKS